MVHCLSIQDDSFDERLGIRSGKCWEVAQSFVMAAKDPNVTLVEGVWTRPDELNEGQQPAPHTWAMVDGYRIDLVGEFYCWRADCEWLYEPLAEYTYADLSKLFGMGPDEDGLVPEGFDISTYLWEQNGGWESLPEHLTKDIPYTRMPNGLYGTPEEHAADDKQSKERDEYENNIVFKPAVDRLIARYTRLAEVAGRGMSFHAHRSAGRDRRGKEETMKRPTDKEIYLRELREREAILNSKTGELISQVIDKIYSTHKDTTKIMLKTHLGNSFQTIMTWDRHADGGYARYTYINKNAREELQKLRNSQNVYTIAYVINDEDEHELVFEPES